MAGGYLPPGLTDEDVEKALAVTQGLPEPQGAPVQYSNEAPASGSVVPPAVEAPHIEQATGSTRQRLNTYKADQLEDANTIVANKSRLGDEAGMTEADHKRQQDIYDRSAEQHRQGTNDAKTELAARREHEARMQAKTDEIFSEMERTKQPPPQKIMSQVLGLLGGIIAGKSPAGGAITSALMGMVGDDQERWAQEKVANSQLYNAALAGMKSDREGQVNDLETAQRVMAMEALEINDALNSAKQMGLGERANAVIDEEQHKFMMGVRNEMIQAEEQKLKAEQSAAAKGASLRARERFKGVPTEALVALRDAGGLDPVGLDELNDRLKSKSAQFGAEKTAAEALKAQNEALGSAGAGQEVMPGYIATIPLEKAEVKEIKQNRRTLTDVQRDFEKLKEIRRRNGGVSGALWKNGDDKVEASNIISGLTGKMNQLVGRGAPSNAELEDMKEQLLDPTGRYVLKDPVEIYNRTVKRLEDNYNAGLDAIGVQRVGQDRAQPAKTDDVAAKMAARGFKPKAAQQAPHPMQRTLDDAESVLAGSGPGGGF